MIRQILTSITVIALCSTALAQRELDRTEILQIFETLTSQPQKTWIPSGTIQAQHHEHEASQTTDDNEIESRIAEAVQAYLGNPDKIELTEGLQQMRLEAIPFNIRYKLSNEYTMDSDVIVKSDGDRFYWEINVDSRTDSVNPGAELEDNFLTEQFDLSCNQKRVFAWDGQRYITYFSPVNHAIITETPGRVNGPLTAGVITWGYGRYSLENLSDANSAAVETEVDGQMQIQLTVTNSDRQETFVLDPAKNYALKRYLADLPNNSSVLHIYDSYQSINGNWCPGSILIERYDTTAQPQRLVAQDIWDFVSISTETPQPSSFEVDYEIDTFIEDFCFGDEPLRYHYSNPEQPPVSSVDTDELMMYRLMVVNAGDKWNCATASLKYVCDKLGVSQSLENLSQIVHGAARNTTLSEMQQFTESVGLNGIAVKTDIETLKDLSSYKVIVHLPMQNHFAVLGDIDSQYVRLIDLSSNNFYFRRSVDCFNSVWDGTAFLVANGPIAAERKFAMIDKAALGEITGSGGGGERCNYQCSGSGNSPCQFVGGSCGGTHTIYYARTCCGWATSGSCSESSMIYMKKEPCIEDPYTSDCVGNGNWTSYYMLACN